MTMTVHMLRRMPPFDANLVNTEAKQLDSNPLLRPFTMSVEDHRMDPRML